MNVSVEVSMYPLVDDYIPPIRSFIARLSAYDNIRVIANTMSTQVFGSYQHVMEILAAEMQRSHRHTPKASFVLKVLNGDLSPDG